MHVLIAKGIGALLALAGFLLSVLPGLILDIPPNKPRFAAIETRSRFGALAGFGLGLSLLPAFDPWTTALAYLAFWTTLGFVAARGIGLLLDGYHPRQLMWIGVELAVAGCLAWYLWG